MAESPHSPGMVNPLQVGQEAEDKPAEPRFRYLHSQGLAEFLHQLHITIFATTYQAGRVLAFSSKGSKCSLLMRAFPHPMGVAIDGDRLALLCKTQVWFMVNQTDLVSAEGKRPQYDAYFIPRMSHVTGDIGGHEIAWGQATDSNGTDAPELWVVNTRFACLATLDPQYSFVPRWHPPFISKLEPGDRCHLNGLTMQDGKPKYVSAFSQTDTPQGWREHRANGGIVLDVDSGEVVTHGLAMPHSPRLWNGNLWVLDSGRGELQQVDLKSGRRETVIRLPGFTRGLAFYDKYAFIGLSKAREKRTFGDLPLSEKIGDLECAIYVIDITTGKEIGFIKFELGCDELFDVQVIAGIRSMNVIGFTKDTINGIFVVPRDHLDGKPIGTAIYRRLRRTK